MALMADLLCLLIFNWENDGSYSESGHDTDRSVKRSPKNVCTGDLDVV
jgi:hypothetical protein